MKPATLLETWKTLLTVLLEHDKFQSINHRIFHGNDCSVECCKRRDKISDIIHQNDVICYVVNACYTNIGIFL